MYHQTINYTKLAGYYRKVNKDPLRRDRTVSNYYHPYAIDSAETHETTNNTTTGLAPGEGPWLDFMIVGNPKCGTTTLMANLRRIAPMPVKDFCAGAVQTLRNAYDVWPHDPNITQHVLLQQTPVEKDPVEDPSPTMTTTTTRGGDAQWLRGSKCPRFLNQNFMLGFSALLPKTKFIIGLRHPVTWFASFVNMVGGAGVTFLDNLDVCPCPVNIHTGIRPRHCPDVAPHEACWGECRCQSLYCLHRARFHLPLARLGKTALSHTERTHYLAPQDADGGTNVLNFNVSNPIFVYDLQQMGNSTQNGFWDDLAHFLGVSSIPNEDYHSSHGLSSSSTKKNKDRSLTLCHDRHDYFRSLLMGYSYELSMWLQLYFIPVVTSTDPTIQRTDVTIAGMTPTTTTTSGGGGRRVEEFQTIVESYKYDPCERLIRRPADGKYVLKEKFRISTTSDTASSSRSSSSSSSSSIVTKNSDGTIRIRDGGMDTLIPKQCEDKKHNKQARKRNGEKRE